MKIAIIGCGNMGSAIAQRLSQGNQLFLYDHNEEKVELLAHQGYGKVCKNIKEALPSTEMVILAIKPQGIKPLAGQIKDHLREDQMVVSLLAGTTIKSLKQYFSKVPIVRMMPNLALLHGEGVIAL